MDIQKLNIGYIEYWYSEKELNYIVNLISKLNDTLSRQINLYIQSDFLDDDKINLLSSKVNSLTFFSSLKEFVFQNVDLGIIPSTIENNIAQSTIEFLKHNVPVLCGNIGSDWELCSHELFKFDVGNFNSFEEKLSKLINKPELLEQYWLNQSGIAKEFIEKEASEVGV